MYVFCEEVFEWDAFDFFWVSWSEGFVWWDFYLLGFVEFHGFEAFVYGFEHPAFADDYEFWLVDFAFFVQVLLFGDFFKCGVENLVCFFHFGCVID